MCITMIRICVEIVMLWRKYIFSVSVRYTGINTKSEKKTKTVISLLCCSHHHVSMCNISTIVLQWNNKGDKKNVVTTIINLVISL